MSFGSGATIAAARVVLGVDAGEFSTGLHAAETEFVTSVGQMGGVAAELAERQLRVASSSERLTAAIKTYGAESIQATEATAALIREQRRLTDTQLANYEAQTKFGSVVDVNSTKARSFGSALGFTTNALIGGAGLVFAVKSAVDAAQRFQGEMVLLQTQALKTHKEVENMSAALLKLAPSLATSPDELAKGLYHVESAGYAGAKALNILKTSAMGARLGHADLEQTTNALVAAQKSGISGAKNLGQAMGTLDAIVGAGNMRMQDLAQALQSGVVPAAKQFGLSLKDLGGALDVLTVQGVPANLAATRLRYTISLLGAETPKAAKQLESIGLAQTQVAHVMRTEGLIPALDLLNEKLKASGLSLENQNEILVRAYGGGRSSTTILTLLQNLDMLREKTALIDKEGTQSAFHGRWLAQMATAEYQFARLRSIADVTKIRLGDALLPGVVKATAALNDWLSKTSTQTRLQRDVSTGFKDAADAAHVFGDALHEIGGAMHVIDSIFGQGSALKLLLEGFLLFKAAGIAKSFNAAYITPMRNLVTMTKTATGEVADLNAEMARGSAGGRAIGGMPWRTGPTSGIVGGGAPAVMERQIEADITAIKDETAAALALADELAPVTTGAVQDNLTESTQEATDATNLDTDARQANVDAINAQEEALTNLLKTEQGAAAGPVLSSTDRSLIAGRWSTFQKGTRSYKGVNTADVAGLETWWSGLSPADQAAVGAAFPAYPGVTLPSKQQNLSALEQSRNDILSVLQERDLKTGMPLRTQDEQEFYRQQLYGVERQIAGTRQAIALGGIAKSPGGGAGFLPMPASSQHIATAEYRQSGQYFYRRDTGSTKWRRVSAEEYYSQTAIGPIPLGERTAGPGAEPGGFLHLPLQPQFPEYVAPAISSYQAPSGYELAQAPTGGTFLRRVGGSGYLYQLPLANTPEAEARAGLSQARSDMAPLQANAESLRSQAALEQAKAEDAAALAAQAKQSLAAHIAEVQQAEDLRAQRAPLTERAASINAQLEAAFNGRLTSGNGVEAMRISGQGPNLVPFIGGEQVTREQMLAHLKTQEEEAVAAVDEFDRTNPISVGPSKGVAARARETNAAAEAQAQVAEQSKLAADAAQQEAKTAQDVANAYQVLVDRADAAAAATDRLAASQKEAADAAVADLKQTVSYLTSGSNADVRAGRVSGGETVGVRSGGVRGASGDALSQLLLPSAPGTEEVAGFAKMDALANQLGRDLGSSAKAADDFAGGIDTVEQAIRRQNAVVEEATSSMTKLGEAEKVAQGDRPQLLGGATTGILESRLSGATVSPYLAARANKLSLTALEEQQAALQAFVQDTSQSAKAIEQANITLQEVTDKINMINREMGETALAPGMTSGGQGLFLAPKSEGAVAALRNSEIAATIQDSSAMAVLASLKNNMGMNQAMGLGMLLTMFGGQMAHGMGLGGASSMLTGAGAGMMFLPMLLGERAGLGSGALVGASFGAGSLIRRNVHGQTGRFLGDASQGAMLGAGVGMMFPELGGPFTGAAVGAAAGLAVQGFKDLFSSSDETSKKLLALANAADKAHMSVKNAETTLQGGKVALANDRVTRDQYKAALQQAEAEEKATRGTDKHAAALDNLRAAEQNYRASIRQVNADMQANQKTEQEIVKGKQQEQQRTDQLAASIANVARTMRLQLTPYDMYLSKSQQAADHAQAFASRMEDLANKAQHTNPKLAETYRDLANITNAAHKIPSKEFISVYVKFHVDGKSLDKSIQQELDQRHNLISEAAATNQHRRRRHGHGHNRHVPGFTDPSSATYLSELQSKIDQIQAGLIKGNVKKLEEEELAWLRTDYKRARTSAEKDAVAQAISQIQSQMSAATKHAISNGGIGLVPQRLQDRYNRAYQSGNKSAEYNALIAEQKYLERLASRTHGLEHHKAEELLNQVVAKIDHLTGATVSSLAPMHDQLAVQKAIREELKHPKRGFGGVIAALEKEANDLAKIAARSHGAQREKALSDENRIRQQIAAYEKKQFGTAGADFLTSSAQMEEWIKLQNAYYKAEQTPGTKDDIRTLRAEQAFLQRARDHLHGKQQEEANKLLAEIDKKLQKLVVLQAQTVKDLENTYLTDLASFFSSFGSNVFTTGKNGQNVEGSQGNVNVHQYFPPDTASDHDRHAIYAKHAMQSRFD